MEEREPTTKETLEVMRDLGTMMALLDAVKPKLDGYLKLMDKQLDGTERTAWFQVISKVSEDSEDDLIAMLMLTLGSLSKVRVTIKGTSLEKELREALGLPEPEVPEVEEPLAGEGQDES